MVVEYELRVARVTSLFKEILSGRGVDLDKLNNSYLEHLAGYLAETSYMLLTMEGVLSILEKNERIRKQFDSVARPISNGKVRP